MDYNGSVSTVGLVIAGAVFVAGARTWSWRKAMTLLMLVGAMAGVPTLLGILQGFNNVATYQPRYMMPLWIVFLFFMLTMERRERTLSRPQAAAVGVLLVGTHFWALFVLLLRYTHGSSVLMFNMSKTAVWWWPGAPLARTWSGRSARCASRRPSRSGSCSLAKKSTRSPEPRPSRPDPPSRAQASAVQAAWARSSARTRPWRAAPTAHSSPTMSHVIWVPSLFLGIEKTA